MSFLEKFSINVLFLLFVFCICIRHNLLSNLNTNIIYHMKWASNFILQHTSFRHLKFDLAEEIDQEIISIRRYEPKSGSEGSVECAVCLSGIEEGNEIREIRCDHLFHKDCLDKWVKGSRNLTCPLCRCSLGPRRIASEQGEELLFFKFSSFSSSERIRWGLR
ncbi:hypothetical protein LguiB_025051 [Lonicera macranthoides]